MQSVSNDPRLRRSRLRMWLAQCLASVCGRLALYLREDRTTTLIAGLWVLTQLASIGWDLPCMYGWENDGVAPRDIFGGLADNLTPGHGDRYPLLHYLVLAALTWPLVLASVLTARSFTLEAVLERVLSVPTLTSISLVAKLVAVAMGALSLLALARIARRTVSVSAGRWTVAFAATNLTVGYYGRVSNLDGPYLMWTALAVDRLLDVFERGEPRDYRGLAICAAASIATKDQAYASYVLTLPIYLVALPLWSRSALPAGAQHFRRLTRAAVAGALSLGLLGGGLLNPTGFVYRMHLLTGTNSQDWRHYAPTLAGRLQNALDLVESQAEFFWPWPVVVFAWCGVVLACWPRAEVSPLHKLHMRLLPLVLALSATLAFTLVVGRCEHRFVLPLGFWLSYYAGLVAASLLAPRAPALRALGTALLTALLVFGATHDLALHLTQWGDARNRVERWLAERPAGTVVETYGLGVYLPRFDLSLRSPYRVQRVGPQPVRRRPPIPGIREVQDAYGHVQERAPDVLIITSAFVNRFLPAETGPGLAAAAEREKYQRDADACTFFRSALANKLLGYRLSFEAKASLPGWLRALGLAPLAVHGSTSEHVWVLTRVAEGALQK